MTKPFETMTIEQVAQYPRPGTAIPGAIQFSPDGKLVTYLQSGEGSLVRSLWSHDIASGETEQLIRPPKEATTGETISREEELRRERARMRELGVTEYQFGREAKPWVLLVPLTGKLWIQREGEALRELPGTEGALDARLTRDGTKVAFVRGGEVWVAATDGAEAPVRITSGAEPGITNGVAEFIAQEELDRAEGYWWSQDGAWIAYVRADSRHIPVYPIVHQGKDAVDIEEHRYPFAGAANAKVELYVVGADGGEPMRMNIGPDDDQYIARVAWRPDGVLMAGLLTRDQKSMRWIALDPATGAGTPLIEETGEPWFNLEHDTRFLESGEILVSSERSGYRHLYVHDATGKPVRMLTSGEWVVTHVVAVDEKGRRVFFSGTRESVLERHLYMVSLDGGEVTRLTEGSGWHGTVVSPDYEWFVDMHSRMTHAPIVTLRAVGGSSERVLFANDGFSAEELGLTPPTLMTVETRDGVTLHGALYEPAGREGQMAPVIVSVYGGPHAQRVADEWSMTVDMRAQHLARLGYRVFKLDNRGSANRGLGFEAALAGALGSVEVEDHVEGLIALQRMGLADMGRVGIYGWSYGGYMVLMAMLRAPNIFQVGVAGAPVTDWDGYDTGYTERYMGTPATNPEGYKKSSVLTHVAALRGKLLVVHGMVDENVHFRHTARLAVALADAQKSYDLLAFPEERHMPRDAKGMEYQERRVAGYFTEHLKVE
ncbi:MAG: S9 family peptidase [Tepidiformaceae bacterium]